MLPGKLCHCRMSSLQPMHRLGVLVAQLLVSKVRRCWDFRSLLLKDYWHGMMCAIVGGIQMGSALYEPHSTDRESNKSSVTQMSYVLGGVGGRRSREPASY